MKNHNTERGKLVRNARFLLKFITNIQSCFCSGLRCRTTSGVMAAKITLAWVSFEIILAFSVSNVRLLFLTLTLCLHRSPLQCREKESGQLLQYSNLQVETYAGSVAHCTIYKMAYKKMRILYNLLDARE